MTKITVKNISKTISNLAKRIHRAENNREPYENHAALYHLKACFLLTTVAASNPAGKFRASPAA